MTLLILMIVVVAVVVLWVNRVKIIAKLTGQSEARVGRQLNRRK
jgi:hypothetical protein